MYPEISSDQWNFLPPIALDPILSSKRSRARSGGWRSGRPVAAPIQRNAYAAMSGHTKRVPVSTSELAAATTSSAFVS